MIHSKKLSQKGQSRIAFLPIKPIYAERIIAGEKLFEFRKTMFKKDIAFFIIYSSSPIKKIMGVAKVKAIKIASPFATWEMTKHAAGISRRLFREYFQGVTTACAIEIEEITVLVSPIAPTEIDPAFKVPQSFCYVDDKFLRKIIERGGIVKEGANSGDAILN